MYKWITLLTHVTLTHYRCDSIQSSCNTHVKISWLMWLITHATLTKWSCDDKHYTWDIHVTLTCCACDIHVTPVTHVIHYSHMLLNVINKSHSKIAHMITSRGSHILLMWYTCDTNILFMWNTCDCHMLYMWSSHVTQIQVIHMWHSHVAHVPPPTHVIYIHIAHVIHMWRSCDRHSQIDHVTYM